MNELEKIILDYNSIINDAINKINNLKILDNLENNKNYKINGTLIKLSWISYNNKGLDIQIYYYLYTNKFVLTQYAKYISLKDIKSICELTAEEEQQIKDAESLLNEKNKDRISGTKWKKSQIEKIILKHKDKYNNWEISTKDRNLYCISNGGYTCKVIFDKTVACVESTNRSKINGYWKGIKSYKELEEIIKKYI